MALVNTMEQMVDMALRNIQTGGVLEFCTCEQCLEDIKCLTLNALPSRYVSTQKGELYSKLTQFMFQQHSIDINIALINSIEFVKSHPHHDAEHTDNK